MEVGVFGIFAIAAMVGILVGPSMWGDVLNLGVLAIRIIGCWVTIISLVYLIMFSLIVKALNDGKKTGAIFSAIGGVILCAAIFGLFCYLNLVPGMPQDEVARTVYGWMAIGALILGGMGTGGGLVIVFFIK